MRRHISYTIIFLAIALFSTSSCKKEKTSVVNTPVKDSLTISLSGFLYSKMPITFTSNVDSTTDVLWNFGDGKTSSAHTPVHKYEEWGTYTITLVANGHTTKQKISLKEQLNFFYSGATIPGEAISFILSDTVPATTTYYWQFGDGSTSTEPTPEHQYAKTGTYSISLVLNGKYNIASEHYDKINILTDPVYTSEMIASGLWQITKHEVVTGKFDTTYTYNDNVAISMINKITLDLKANTMINGTVFYNTGLSKDNFLVFTESTVSPKCILTYNRIADTMNLTYKNSYPVTKGGPMYMVAYSAKKL